MSGERGPERGRANDEPGWVRWSRRTSEALILAMACLAPWAFGAVDAWAAFGLEVGIALVTLLGLVVDRGSGRARRLLCLPSLALAGLALLALAQAAPLPDGVLRRLAPSEHALRASLIPAASERVVGDPGPPVAPPPPTLSQEPGATIDTAARLLAAWLLFQGVLGLGGGYAPLRRFGMAIAINATLLALFSVVQALTWNGKIYWVRPLEAGRSGWSSGGPFVCHSHLAEYLNVGLGFVLGFLLLEGRDGARSWAKGWRPWAAYAAGVLVVGIVSSQSRGGFLAMLLAAAIMSLALRRRPAYGPAREPSRPATASPIVPWVWLKSLGIGLVAMLALIILFLFALGEASPYQRRLSTIFDSADKGYSIRTEIWRESLGAWRYHPIWGTGLGSFAAAAAPHFRHDHGIFFSHAENEYVQMLVEGGAIGLALALTALVAIARLGRRALDAAPSPRNRAAAFGAMFGGLALAIHSLSDFGLHIPGVAVPVVILAAHLCRLGLEGGGQPRASVSRPPRGIGTILAGLAMVPLSFAVAAHGWDETRAEALLAEADVPLPGVELPTADRGNVPIDELERMRAALQGTLRLRPDRAEGHLRLGIVYLGLYEQTAAQWAGGTLEDPEVAQLADPLHLLGVVHSAQAGRAPSAVALLEHEPIRRYLVPAARSFLEARRCCPVSALAEAELASLAYLLRGGDPSPIYAERALRLAGADAKTIAFIARVAAQSGDLDLAARCWRKSLEAREASWEEVADAAGAVLSPGQILRRVLPPGGRYALRFADRLYAAPEAREARDRFLKAALARLPDDADLTPTERLWLEAQARARLGDRKRARQEMEAALATEPLRDEWRAEFVGWLIDWRDLEEAHRQALVGTQLDPANPGLQRALKSAIEALAKGGP